MAIEETQLGQPLDKVEGFIVNRGNTVSTQQDTYIGVCYTFSKSPVFTNNLSDILICYDKEED